MMRTGLFALLVTLAACSGTAPPTSVAPSPSPEPPSAPCAVDADCRLWDGPACSCRVALTTATVNPSPTPCFVAPCMNREAFCDAATHACSIRTATPPPPPSTAAAPATDVAPAPDLDSIAPIS